MGENKALERSRAAEAERRNEPLLREAADSTPAPVWMTDRTGAMEFANRAFEELAGVPGDKLLGDGWIAFIHPDDLPIVAARRAEAWANDHAAYTYEARFRRADGAYRWWEVSSRPRRDSDGGFHGYVGLAIDRTEARAAAAALGESEARLRLAVEAGRMGVWEWDIPTNQVRWSPELEAIHGLAPGAFGGTFEAFQSDMHPEDREPIAAAVQRTLTDGEAHHVEYRIILPDGQMRWVEGRGKLFRDEHGAPERMVGVCTDVTERRRADDALRESEQRYRELVDGLSDAIVWEGDPADLSFTFVSDAAERLLGYPAAEWIETPSFWVDKMHPDDRVWAPAFCRRETEAGRNHEFEYRMIAADGRIVWLHDKVYVSARGGRKLSRGLMVDITRTKQTAEILRASEARYRAVVESQPNMVCRFRPDGHILFANSAYARARGLAAEDMAGLNFWQWVAEKDRPAVRAMLDGLTPENPEVRIENRFTTSEGDRWTLWINRAIAFDENGRWSEAQSTGIDIDERKRAEEHRKLLLDELNHRVKNTLAVVQGIAQQSFRGAAADSEARHAFEGRLSALAKAHSLLTRAHWEAAPLDAVVDDVTHACGPARERIAVAGPALTLSPRQALSIAMALHELCTNALKYGALSSEAGAVDLIWAIADEHIEITWRERGGPPVTAPKQRGYGSMMIERALAHELGGSARLDFQPHGLVCVIRAPLAETPS